MISSVQGQEGGHEAATIALGFRWTIYLINTKDYQKVLLRCRKGFGTATGGNQRESFRLKF
jgi:hypothetical protein